MSKIEKTHTIAANPSTQRATAVHLSYDPKSDRIAYASGKSVFIRSVSNPSETVQFTQHNFNTTVAKFAPSGFYIASGDESGNVKVWDTQSEDLIVKGEYQIINGRINDIAWDADSNRIIAVGNGKERYGHCFTWDSGNTVGEISGHTAPINAVSIRPVRPYRAATVSDDAGLVFLQGPPFKFSQSVRGQHNNFVRDVKFSKDGAYIVSVGADRAVVLYEGKTGELIRKFEKVHEGGIFSVDWYDENSFVTSSADNRIKLINIEGETLKTWSLEKKIENQILGVVKTKNFIIALTLSGFLYYFNDSSDDPVNVVYGHQKSITALAFDKSKGLLTGSYDGNILNWDLKKKEAVLVEGKPHSNLVIGIEEVSNGFITAGWDDVLKKIEGSKIQDITSLEKQPIATSSFADKLAVITEEELALYSSTGELLKSIKLGFTPSAVAISSKFVIVANSTTFELKFYDPSLQAISKTLQPNLRAKVSALELSQNEKYLAAGDVSGKINCYNLEEFALVTSRWAFHTSKINSISWNQDNDHIVSSSLDTNMIIYSVTKPVRNVKVLNIHKEGVSGAVWLDGDEIVSVGADACLKFWKVSLA